MKAKTKLSGIDIVLENRTCKHQGLKSYHISSLYLLRKVLLRHGYTHTKLTCIYVCKYAYMLTCKYVKWYTMTLTRQLWSHIVFSKTSEIIIVKIIIIIIS